MFQRWWCWRARLAATSGNPSGPPRRITSVATEISRGRTGWGMIAGLLAAGAAVGVGQLFAGIVAPDGSPVVAVGEASIDHTPPAVKNFAISAFGSNDKTVLVAGILAVLAIFAAIVGALAVRRLWYGMVGLACFAALGLAAALTRPTASPSYAVPTLVGAAAAIVALALLVRAVPPASAAASPPTGLASYADPSAVAGDADPPSVTGPRPPAAPIPRQPVPGRPPTGAPRRSFLATGSPVAGTAALGFPPASLVPAR